MKKSEMIVLLVIQGVLLLAFCAFNHNWSQVKATYRTDACQCAGQCECDGCECGGTLQGQMIAEPLTTEDSEPDDVPTADEVAAAAIERERTADERRRSYIAFCLTNKLEANFRDGRAEFLESNIGKRDSALDAYLDDFRTQGWAVECSVKDPGLPHHLSFVFVAPSEEAAAQ